MSINLQFNLNKRNGREVCVKILEAAQIKSFQERKQVLSLNVQAENIDKIYNILDDIDAELIHYEIL